MEYKPITVGVAIIAKNEEAMLGKCLESVKGLDQIVVVDTGSIDKTVEVAKKYTDEVYTDFTWCDSFAKARNHVLSKMKTDYVLSIDADEFLHSVPAVREAVELAALRGSYAVNVKMIADDTGQFFYFPRLFRRDPKVWWEGDIHNHISVGGEDMGIVAITHGYSPAHLLDKDRALRILTRVVNETGNAREMFYLGREHWYRHEFEKCVKILGQYVQKSKFLSEKADAFLIMARCYWAMSMPNDARDACVQAIIINANFKEAILFMAVLAGEGHTNKLWDNNGKQWHRMADTASNEGVLFIRNL